MIPHLPFHLPQSGSVHLLSHFNMQSVSPCQVLNKSIYLSQMRFRKLLGVAFRAVCARVFFTLFPFVCVLLRVAGTQKT